MPAPMTSGEAAAEEASVVAQARALRPKRPGDGEAILWQGRPAMLGRKLMELVGFLLLLGLLSWLAVELIQPHLAGSAFAGRPDDRALPLILMMTSGVMLIIALPVWLRSSAQARARYMLTNRRALIWLGNSIVGEAMLFGADMETRFSAGQSTGGSGSVSFEAPGIWLDWRLKDEGDDRVRFLQIADALTVAEMAEDHGARWNNRPADPEEPAP